MSKRAEYILQHFQLRPTSRGFEAIWSNPDGSVFARIEGANRDDVVRRARCRWGHFNFADEYEAFCEIFPPVSA